jgi:putative ATPase
MIGNLQNQSRTPLADRMRPRNLSEFVGQEKLLSKGGVLRTMLEMERLQSFILWGPPGVGKTTLARLLASQTKSKWIAFSAVTSGIKEIKAVMAEAEAFMNIESTRTLLFVDEIHRFNKAQQDAFLPYVENGTILLIGATTENPSFELNSALLSRLKVFVLEELGLDDLAEILRRALSDEERGLKEYAIEVSDEQLRLFGTYASGDARIALNSLELACILAKQSGEKTLSEKHIKDAIQQMILKYDKAGENHFNLISALHKSMRNSDVDASLYWLARMLEAGEDPLYVARRIVRFASEDIGLAVPQALPQAVAAMQTVELIGMPEAKLALAQAVIYLASAPKSNAVYQAYEAAARDALNSLQHPVPMHLRNAPTKLMKELGYAKSYKYAHDFKNGKADDMQCLPEELKGVKYYTPSQRGFEAKLDKNDKSNND